MTTKIDIGTVRTMKTLDGRLWAPDYTSLIFNPVDFQALVDKTVNVSVYDMKRAFPELNQP